LGLLYGARFLGCVVGRVDTTEWRTNLILFKVARTLKIRVVVEATALELETRWGEWVVGPFFFSLYPKIPTTHLTPSMVEFHT
jgi:hypothetical protein